MRTSVALAALGLAALWTAWDAREARACGGCFTAPPPPPPPVGPPPVNVDSLITSERMIFSISKDQTTLFDEITYSGAPASFAWVLPIRGEVEVGLSADALFAAIDSMTSVEVAAPPENCPVAPTCSTGYGGYGGSFLCGCGSGGEGSGQF